MFLMHNIFRYMTQNQIQKSYLWVNCDNTIVKEKIHLKNGFKTDGLKDYTFIKL